MVMIWLPLGLGLISGNNNYIIWNRIIVLISACGIETIMILIGDTNKEENGGK